jgi:hypothetical protein
MAAQIREQVIDTTPRFRTGGDDLELDLAVSGEQAQQFNTRVPGASHDACLDHLPVSSLSLSGVPVAALNSRII